MHIDHTLLAAAIGVGGSICGGFTSGFYTLRGVNRTIRRNENERFIESLPQKIKSIDLIVNELHSLYMTLDFEKQSSLEQAKDVGLTLINDSLCDGYIYKEVRRFNDVLRSRIDSLYDNNAAAGATAIFYLDDTELGEWTPIPGQEKEAKKREEELRQHIAATIDRFEKYHAKLSDRFVAISE